jgi:hypothetical protein
MLCIGYTTSLPDEGFEFAERDPLIRLRGVYHRAALRADPLAQAPSPTKGERKGPLTNYGVMEIGEKSTNQLFGCTKPLIFGLMARGATSWAT